MIAVAVPRAVMMVMLTAVLLAVSAASAAPPPVENLRAIDRPWDAGEAALVTWDAPDGEVARFLVYRSRSAKEAAQFNRQARIIAASVASADVTARLTAEGVAPEDIRQQAREAAKAAADQLAAEQAAVAGELQWMLVGDLPATARSMVIDRLDPADQRGFFFRVEAVGPDGSISAPASTTDAVRPSSQFFDMGRLWLAIITTVLCGAVLTYIVAARRGMPMRVRTIAGLAAVDEAVGRATEMGRPVLFVPGTQDMNDIQTVAGITILSRVGKTAAEYDAQVEVPTSRSLVMTAARETMHAAFLQAGRPDAFNPDLVYYVTDEQFGFVAYLSGMMVREKPAACFYMGAFFAESLILAETGNSVGAIQIAGTAQPAQLPFFVAACDYTLIGEEFFAASAYLSGEPEQLGSLKGQDVGKLIVAGLVILGCIIATVASVTGNERFIDALNFLRNTMLT